MLIRGTKLTGRGICFDYYSLSITNKFIRNTDTMTLLGVPEGFNIGKASSADPPTMNMSLGKYVVCFFSGDPRLMLLHVSHVFRDKRGTRTSKS